MAILPKKAESRTRRRKRDKARLLYWLVFALSLLLLGASVFGRDGMLAVIVNQRRISRLQAEILDLKEGNQDLRGQIRSLRSDLRSVERIAREDLGLVKPGEKVYEFIEEKKRSR